MFSETWPNTEPGAVATGAAMNNFASKVRILPLILTGLQPGVRAASLEEPFQRFLSPTGVTAPSCSDVFVRTRDKPLKRFHSFCSRQSTGLKPGENERPSAKRTNETQSS